MPDGVKDLFANIESMIWVYGSVVIGVIAFSVIIGELFGTTKKEKRFIQDMTRGIVVIALLLAARQYFKTP